MALEYFPWYYSYQEKCKKLTDQELGRLVRALSRYGETGEMEELAGRESIAFDFIADDIDRAKASYEEKCAKNKANATERKRTLPNATERTQNKTEDKTKEKTKEDNPLSNDSRLYARTAAADYLNRINPSASPRSLDELAAYEKQMGFEVCSRAFDIALDNKKTSWSYIRAILSKWQSLGVKCLADIEEKDKKPEGKPAKSSLGLDFNSPEYKSRIGNDTAWLKNFCESAGLNKEEET